MDTAHRRRRRDNPLPWVNPAAIHNNTRHTKMKKLLLAVLCAGATTVAFAQTTSTTTTKTTTSTGTIHEYSPGTSFVVKESSGPVNYRYGKSVTYVTKKGKTLSEADVKTRIRVGAPVSVHYTTEGDNRVISRVEVDDD